MTIYGDLALQIEDEETLVLDVLVGKCEPPKPTGELPIIKYREYIYDEKVAPYQNIPFLAAIAFGLDSLDRYPHI